MPVLRPIFYMYQREAARVSIEIRKGILTPNGDPAKIHLHLHELWICLRQKKIVRQFSIHGVCARKLKIMIVIAELNSSLLASLTGAIEKFCSMLPAVGIFSLGLWNR